MPILSDSTTLRACAYLRVSSDDQAERGTIGAQRDFLRRYADLQEIPLIDMYVDDGFSGTLPLSDRPEGRRLLADAKAGRFDTVLVYRLGRSLAALLDAHTTLDRCGVTIRSCTEPFDTSTSIGRFLFSLLASMAELEKDTITERMVMGRDRVARGGKWTNGPIPIGYDLDEQGSLTPSLRLLPSGETEADGITGLFERMAEGSTTIAEARRFNALEVPLTRRYAGGKEVLVSRTGSWPPSRIRYMIMNPTYKGTYVLKSRRGEITCEVPALVTVDLWERANARMRNNRTFTTHGSNQYLLKSLIVCDICGSNFVGTPGGGFKEPAHYYRCGSQLGVVNPEIGKRCRAKSLRAETFEPMIWQDVREFIRNPGDALADAQAQLRQRLSQSATTEVQRRHLLQRIAEQDDERERVTTLFRRGRISLDDAERQLDAINAEGATLRALLAALETQATLVDVWESRVSDAAAMLAVLREQLEEIETTDDFERKQETVRLLVSELRVCSEGTGHKKTAIVKATYVFGPPKNVGIPNTSSRASILYRGSVTT